MENKLREVAARDGGPRFRIVTITPDIASAWLSLNPRNRPLNRRRVEEYARLMAAGRWVMNGEAISFDTDGFLIQGQHRLHGCIKAGVPFTSLVVEGLHPEVFSTLDQGAKRTLSDLMALDGERNTKMLAAAATRLWRYERGNLNHTGNRPSGQEGLETLERHPGLRNSVPFGFATRVLGHASVMTFLHYLFSRRDAPLADRFMRALATGEFIGPQDPVYLLRSRLIANSASKAKLPEKEVTALTIKAWNATREGTELHRLRWRSSGDKPEAFPTIL